MEEHRVKHLELLQHVIDRMASNSFLIKGWPLTLLSALLVLGLKDKTEGIIHIVFIPTVMFWILDSYFLKEERLFRKLYDRTRQEAHTETDFAMNPALVMADSDTVRHAMFSPLLIIFHGTLIFVLVIIELLHAFRR
jgi:hypothetical protein